MLPARLALCDLEAPNWGSLGFRIVLLLLPGSFFCGPSSLPFGGSTVLETYSSTASRLRPRTRGESIRGYLRRALYHYATRSPISLLLLPGSQIAVWHFRGLLFALVLFCHTNPKGDTMLSSLLILFK